MWTWALHFSLFVLVVSSIAKLGWCHAKSPRRPEREQCPSLPDTKESHVTLLVVTHLLGLGRTKQYWTRLKYRAHVDSAFRLKSRPVPVSNKGLPLGAASPARPLPAL